MYGFDPAVGSGREEMKNEMEVSSPVLVDSPSISILISVWIAGLIVEGLNSASGGLWISTDQALERLSISKSSRRILILPQESQLGGITILSRSMMLYLTVSLFRSE